MYKLYLFWFDIVSDWQKGTILTMSEQIERQMDNYSDAELIKLRDSVLDLANRIEKRIAIPPKNA